MFGISTIITFTQPSPLKGEAAFATFYKTGKGYSWGALWCHWQVRLPDWDLAPA